MADGVSLDRRHNHLNRYMGREGDISGVEEQGMLTRVHPGTWETLPSPQKSSGLGAGRPKPRPAGARCSATCGSEKTGAAAVPPSEGNEARRDGRQGVAAPRSTGEAGEATRGTPWREGGVGGWNRWRDRRRKRIKMKIKTKNSIKWLLK